MTVRFTPDLYRGVDADVARGGRPVGRALRDRGVVGLGLGGMEAGMPAAPYRRAFEIARDGGLGIVPHAGEAAGADSIREILAHGPGPDPARHPRGRGPDLLAEIAERGLVLDVCPTSNVRTGVRAALADHPLPALRAAGVRCTINTDDPAMFGTDLGRGVRGRRRTRGVAPPTRSRPASPERCATT